VKYCRKGGANAIIGAYHAATNQTTTKILFGLLVFELWYLIQPG